MNYIIDSHSGAGMIQFGMNRAKARSAMKPAKATPRISFVFKVPIDNFLDLGVRIHYDSHENCEAIEFSMPSTVTLRDHSLLNLPFGEVADRIRAIDPTATIHKAGLTSFQLGVGLYIPDAIHKPNDLVQGVIAFSKGYYERYGVTFEPISLR